MGTEVDLLCKAAFSNDVATVRKLLQDFVDPNCRVKGSDETGFFLGKIWPTNTPLTLAVYSKSYLVVQLLIKAKCDVNIQDRCGRTAIHLACIGGDKGLVKYLLMNGGATNIRDYQDMTPLSETKDLQIASMLIHYGASVNSGHLTKACQIKGGLPLVEFLVHSGSRVNEVANQTLDIPLLTVLKSGKKNIDVDIVKFLIKAGSDLEWENRAGQTALSLAIRYSTLEIVLFILENNASLFHVSKTGRLPLHWAASHGSPEVLELFLQYQYDESYFYDEPVIFAALDSENIDNFKLLLKYKYSVNSQNFSLETALHRTCERNLSEMVIILLEHGCNPNIQNRFGQTALHYSCKFDRSDIVHKLILGGCDVNLQDRNKQTALQIACTFQQINVLKVLIKLGVNIDQFTNYSILRSIIEKPMTLFPCENPNKLTTKQYINEKMIYLLIRADYNICLDKSILPFSNFQSSLSQKIQETYREMFCVLALLSRYPLSLQQLSCLCIRKCLSINLEEKVEKLISLPKSLKDLVGYKYL